MSDHNQGILLCLSSNVLHANPFVGPRSKYDKQRAKLLRTDSQTSHVDTELTISVNILFFFLQLLYFTVHYMMQ